MDADLLSWDEADEYWPILALDLSREETMGLSNEERSRKRGSD